MPARQLPEPGEVFLDHVAHFVPDLGVAGEALGSLGFTVTPRTPQMNAGPDGALVPAGTENRCVMLGEGYLEFLTPVALTPLAERMRSQLARYTGPHLVCFSDADPERVRDRLERAGFAPEAPVRLRRRIGTTAGGEEELRFSVVRVPPGAMPEGRIQYVVHHTPELLWQSRWTSHANGARALLDVLIVVEHAAARASSYAGFTGRHDPVPPGGDGLSWVRLERGGVVLVEPRRFAEAVPGIGIPALPWIAGYAVRVDDLDLAGAAFVRGGARVSEGRGVVVAALPPVLGGIVVLSAGATSGFADLFRP
ncbi:MAG TPA: VOC family protein [Geminicoccaceae bacterium]